MRKSNIGAGSLSEVGAISERAEELVGRPGGPSLPNYSLFISRSIIFRREAEQACPGSIRLGNGWQ